MQARLASALHRLTDLPLKDCQIFLEDEWDMRLDPAWPGAKVRT